MKVLLEENTRTNNQKAYGMKTKQTRENQRVNSASTQQRSRSIHMKQEHIKVSQHQQLNEEIMKERNMIIKYNR